MIPRLLLAIFSPGVRLRIWTEAFVIGIFAFICLSAYRPVTLAPAIADAAQIIIDPANPAATEIAVNQDNTLQLKPLVLDSAGNTVENAPVVYASLNSNIATVDASGKIQGVAAGFSTLTVSSGSAVAAVTITVAKITSGASGFEITGVAQDLARRVYLADTRNHAVLLAEDLEKTPTVYAGVLQNPGLLNDERRRALFNGPAFLAFNQFDGTLYISDSANNEIRLARSGSSGKVETLAGTGQAGSLDGAASQATFNNPQGMALDNRGFLWVADSGNHTIRRINLVTRQAETIAGVPGNPGLTDGRGAQARFNAPVGMALETESLSQQLERERIGGAPPPVSVIVADSGNGLIRRVREDGEVVTINTTPPAKSFSPDRPVIGGPSFFAARPFAAPIGVAEDPHGNIYVTEPASGLVQIILKKGGVVPAAQANTFASPSGIAITQNGKVLVGEAGRSGRQITFGSPTVSSISPQQISNKGGEEITIKGSNFAPDTQVVAAGVLLEQVTVRDTQNILVRSPQLSSGLTTLTVKNRGGLAQALVLVKAATLDSLPSGYITTIAGGSTFAGDGSAATSAPLSPFGVAVDNAGNMFIADGFNNRVRRVDSATGVITTVAGIGVNRFFGDGGLATTAGLYFPQAVAFDAAGNLFIADTANCRVRKVNVATGTMTTVAGDGAYRFFGDGGMAVEASLANPTGIALDPRGNLFIADSANNRVRRVDVFTGVITTVAGDGREAYSGDGGQATAAALSSPTAVTFDGAGNLFISDQNNNRIRKVDAGGIITTTVGNGLQDSSGDDGPATAASLIPGGMAFNAGGDLFVADLYSIRKVDATTRIITTVAGGGDPADGIGDGRVATAAAFSAPFGLSLDAAGNIYVADYVQRRVRRVDATTRIISTVAGNGQERFSGDNGPATAAALTFPQFVAVDRAGDIFIAESYPDYQVRKVAASSGIITTVAGGGAPLDGLGDRGAATNAQLSAPDGLAADGNSSLYIADTFHHRVRRVDLNTGIITTVAGNTEPGADGGFSGDNGQAVAALLSVPSGIALDSSGNLFITDTGNNRVRKVDIATGVIRTVAGGGKPSPGLGDNGPATSANLASPRGIVVDRAGNILIADVENQRIRKVTLATGIITTVAGGGSSSDDNIPATAAELYPSAIVLDAAGNLLLTDNGNGTIREVHAQTGIIATVAGNRTFGTFAGDNGPAIEASFDGVGGLAIDAAGNLFIADTGNHRVRAVHASGRAGRRRP